MREFLLYEGVGRFSPAHLIWLCLAVYSAKALCTGYLRLDGAGAKRQRLTLGVTAAALQLFRAAMLFRDGLFSWEMLPLQLFSASAFLCLAHCIWGGALLGQFLYAVSLPAGLLSLFLLPWSGFGAAHYVTVAGFGGCICVVSYVLMLLASGELCPDICRAPACLGILLGWAAALRLFNLFMGTEHSLLGLAGADGPGRWLDSLWQQPLLAVAALLGWLMMYLPFMLTKKAAD